MKCIIYMWTHPNPNDDAALRGERLWIFYPDISARLVRSVASADGRVHFEEPRKFYHVVADHRLIGAEMTLVLKTLAPEWAETEDEFLSRLKARAVPPDARHVRYVDASSIPQDRTYRNALKHDLTFDMDKCRAIHRDRMRAARVPLLVALDVEYQRADERGDAATKQQVVARKQELREVTGHPDIDAAKTPDALKRAWPAVLGSPI